MFQRLHGLYQAFTVLPYGQTIGEVTLPDGKSLNRELVKVGFAWGYRKYAPEDRVLEELEVEARHARKGLWADADPEAPWEWRKRSRTTPGRN